MLDRGARLRILNAAAAPYLANGYVVIRRREMLLSLLRRRRFDVGYYALFGSTYVFNHALDRDKWVFLAVLPSGEVRVRKS